MVTTYHNRIDKEFSKQVTDLAVNSGNYEPFTAKSETTYINQYGKVETEKSPYGIKPEN